MTELFKGTTALVTGASSGIGEVFARQLAELQTTFSKHAPQSIVARAVAGAMRRMGRAG